MIKQKLQKIFLKDPTKPLLWILIGLFVKCLPLLFLLHNKQPSDIPGIWGATTTDSHSYLDPIDTFLKNGNYYPDYRMPGYGFIYLLLRLAFTQYYSCNILIFLQFFLAGISVYYLALLAKAIFKNDIIFYVCFYLFLFSTYSNFYDGWIMTESLCCSALIFSVWFFVKYFQTGGVKNLLFSGIFIAWTIFLRPVFLPVILFLVIILLLEKKEEAFTTQNKKQHKLLKGLLLLLLPFMLTEATWVTRNYQQHQRIILLTSAKLGPSAKNFYWPPLFHFIHSWGGCADFTDNHSPLLWFGFHTNGMPNPKDYHDSLPAYIYTSQFNRDSLAWLKNKITALNDSILSPEKDTLYQKVVTAKLDKYTLSVKKEKPLLYYIQSPILHALPRFLFGPEVKLYMKRFQLQGKLSLLAKTIFTIFYSLVIVLGLAGMCLLFYKGLKKNHLALIIPIIPFYTVVVHALIIRVTYNRFLMPAWAFVIICAAYIIVKFFGKKKVED